MADDFTILNPGKCGDAMDESAIGYPTPPTIRKRPRVVIGGESAKELVSVTNAAPNPTDYGLVVRPIIDGSDFNVSIPIEYPGTPVTAFDITTLVPTNTETTIANYIVPTGKTFSFIGFVASGNTNALYKIYVDGNPVLAGRSSIATMTLNLTYSLSPFFVTEGLAINLKVVHQTSVPCDFEGTILGYIK